MRPWLAAAVLLALPPPSAFAHALGVDYALRNGKVEVEAFYDDDSPAQNAKVQVVNAKGEIVADGVTDAKGQWACAAPPPGKYEMRVNAGAGHRATKTINVPATPAADKPPNGYAVPAGAPTEKPSPPAVTVSEERTRAEFTRFPWLQVLIGVVVLGGVGGAFALATVLRKNGRS